MTLLISPKSLNIDKSDYTEKNKLSNSNFNYIFEKNKKEIINFPNDITIETINDFNDFKQFYKISFKIYKDNNFWVPPFWSDIKYNFKQKNPFWKHAECELFIVKKDNVVVGRIAAIIDYKFIDKINKKIGYFGYFECINDYNCAKALFQSAQNWLISKKMVNMRGPINGRVDLGCGFLQTGFDSIPTLISSYSQPYYIPFAEKFKMKKIRNQISYYIDLTKPLPKKLKEKAQKCVESGIKVRNFNRFRTQKELKWWIDLFLETFAGHWGYVPVAPEEVKSRFGIKQMRWIVDSSLFLIAEYNNTPVAYIWSLPEYNQIFQKMNGRLGPYQMLQFQLKKKHINLGLMALIGIKKEFRKKNIGSYLNYLILVEMKKKGYKGVDVGWFDEKNIAAHATIAITGAKPYKKFCVFDKNLNNSKKV